MNCATSRRTQEEPYGDQSKVYVEMGSLLFGEITSMFFVSL